MSALRPLLSGIVDYAGLFPPAALDMAAAVRNYAEYRASREAWMLGRFVVPAARLAEFATQLDAIGDRGGQGGAWPVSALLGADVAADLERIDAFNRAERGRASIDTLEARLTTVEAIREAATLLGGRYALFAEIPLDPDPAPLLAAIASAGLKAKIRTGGVTADAFPSASQVVRFMRRCAEAGVAFKATAGLHHPLRAEYRLTYAADAPRGTMYGYLNVFLAAALLPELTDEEATALLEERDPAAIELAHDAIRWRAHVLSAPAASAARDRVAASFGSCSFREPVDELHGLSFTP